ncbi:flagellin [Chitinispirillales bacterium ANBcel5]|uniref:flagellin N-terminal helical domain-containing protein n=1 Tax=Cellulosispirillum alkaliphilum TaxID=3039283 RepID=UPI002A5766C1|nr:flagellin [Chitinispirillales bacterium ANBcel5]
MRINHNISSMVATGALNRTNREMGKSLEKLSTGLRINRASDDAAGLAISERLRTQIRGSRQAQRNAQDGTSLLQIAEGAMNEISEILQRMRELAVQSSNDTLTDVERGYTNEEFKQLRSEIDRIAGVTNYNGMKLISGDAERFGAGDGSTLWIDAGDTAATDAMTIQLKNMTVADLSAEMAGAFEIDSQDNAVAAIGYVDTAINEVNSGRAEIGAIVNRLEHAINNLMVSETNQAAAESLIRDTDFAHETAKFTRNQILTQSGTAMLAQSNMTPQNVLTLL